ncbi:hypothetical protein HWV62_45723, partial [Athelia sp. TMB]
TRSTVHLKPSATSDDVSLAVNDDALTAAKAMFGEDMTTLMQQLSRAVCWFRHSIEVIDGAAQGLDDAVVIQILWELSELNRRFELSALDKVAAPHMWEGQGPSDERANAIRRVFTPYTSFISTSTAFPTVQPGITATTPLDRIEAFNVLRHLMVKWPGCPPDIKFAVRARNGPPAWRVTRSQSPKKTTHVQQVRTTHQLKSSYHKHGTRTATAAGVFTFVGPPDGFVSAPASRAPTCVYFDKLTQITISTCQCISAPRALLARGLFACSPTQPTLAIDIKLLEFGRVQFLHMAPNATGWCSALEVFLKSLGYKLQTMDTLRRRFSNALCWYYSLLDAVESYMQSLLEDVRLDLAAATSRPVPQPASPFPRPRLTTPLPPSSPPPSSPSPSSTPHLTPRPAVTTPQSKSPSHSAALPHFSDDDGPPCPPDRDRVPQDGRPSTYLCRRCPLCFGNTKLDAAARFLSEQDVAKIEAEVASLRAQGPRNPKRNPEEDIVEPGMSVPTSVLDDCGDSFIAADEKREKASTQFFADTGIMSLLCRHDHCLFAVNMTHKGERQHYALALIAKLFDHLPPNTTVGLLYDIAC